MRWIASLVVLCLMAASGVRPAPADTSDPQAEQLEAAKGLAASLTARRTNAGASDLRLQVFILAPAPALPTAVHAIWWDPEVATLRPSAGLRLSCSARGPPVG